MTQVSEKALKRKANKNVILALSSTLVWFIALLIFVIMSSFKALVFGLIAGVVASYCGMNPKGGPKGVGDAVNLGVVLTFLLLFFANLILTAMYLQIVPPKGS